MRAILTAALLALAGALPVTAAPAAEDQLEIRVIDGRWELSADPSAVRVAKHDIMPMPAGLRWAAVRRSGHSHSGKRTVRWAWSERDEGIWSFCTAGCCMSDETGVKTRDF